MELVVIDIIGGAKQDEVEAALRNSGIQFAQATMAHSLMEMEDYLHQRNSQQQQQWLDDEPYLPFD